MNSNAFIPCGRYLIEVDEIALIGWKERLLVERLDRKYRQIKLMLEENNYSWDETLWWLDSQEHFGSQVNAEAFEEIARSIPYNVLLETGQIQTIGEIVSEKMPNVYEFPLHFLRMRPAAFPDVRLKRLAEFICTHKNLFKTDS